MKIWIAVIVLCPLLLPLAGGCSKYKMDVQIKNGAPNLGRDVMTVCDTCGEHSKCGGRDDGLVWATDHSRARPGHNKFTRQACSTGLTVVPRYEGADDRSTNPELANIRRNVLSAGMTVSEARKAINDTGVIESESGRLQTIRFLQTVDTARGKNTRDVWGDFEDGKLVTARYGFWK